MKAHPPPDALCGCVLLNGMMRTPRSCVVYQYLSSYTQWTIATELGTHPHSIMNHPTKNGHKLGVNPPVLTTPKSYCWVKPYHNPQCNHYHP